MKLLKRILFILGILLLTIAAIGFLFFPAHVHVERNVIVNQKPSVAFNYLEDFGNWNKWSPWAQLDPYATYTFEGPKTGDGAIMKWESNVKEVGHGSMMIKAAKPDSVINIDLNFKGSGVANTSFLFSPEGGGTKIVWSFDVDAGVNPLMRILGSMMDGVVGKEYEKGLANLKMKLEAIQEPGEIMAK